jgi:hypothetical protein
VKGIFLPSGAPLLNDILIAPGDLLKGFRIDCDEALFDGSVINKNGLPNPVCTLTVELPWPLRGDERQFWGVDGGAIVGFTPVTLAAEVTARENAITWMPLPPTQKWLNERLLQMFTEMTSQQDPRVLVRLKLAGNFIWGPQRTPKLHLDGEVFGRPGRWPRRHRAAERQRPRRRRPRHVVLAVPPAERPRASDSSRAASAGSLRPQRAPPRSAKKPCNSGSIDQRPTSSACCRPAIKSTPRSASVPTMRPRSRGEAASNAWSGS